MTAAVVIFYFPSAGLADRLLSSLGDQVSAVFVIDNTPSTSLSKPEFLEKFSGFVSYVPLGDNKGIAVAQNIGIEASIKAGYSHVLLLDQDSSLLPGMVKKLLAAEEELLREGKRIAAVCPQIVDERTGKRPTAVYYSWGLVRKVWADEASKQPIVTDNFIASGSLLRADAMKSIGFMREDLFIEYVDTEWALRAHSAGYECYCVPDAVLMQRFGDASAKIFGKDIYLYSNLRYYYKLRNEVYLMSLKTMGWQWRAYAISRIPYHLMVYLAFSSERGAAFCLFLKAIRDGVLGRLGGVAQAEMSSPRERS